MRTATISRPLAVLKLPPQIPEQLKLGEGLQAALVNNPHFPLPDTVIAAFDDALTKYDAAEKATQTRAPGTIAARNAAKVVYVGAVHALKARIQQVADATPEQAEAIITSTTLTVKKTPARTKDAFVARYGVTSGSVEVIARAAALRASYEWQYSVDGAKTWVSVPNTLQAKTTITLLPVATVVEFRFRATTKSGQGDWSQPTSLLVK
ncbi:MAG TPA: fibronectin type III domain-containing protein [Polyangiaceae bacterium]